MKKCLCLIAVLVFLLCSCSGNADSQKIITADMLNITNTEKTFVGSLERFSSVISAMKAKVSVPENGHNKAIRVQNPDEYFLENDYIHTAFEPFVISSFEITEGFHSEMTDEEAKNFYKLISNGADIVFESDGETSFSLKLVSEELTEEYSAEYNIKSDSFRYVFKTEDGEGEQIEEFLEFSKAENGAYIIQSNTTRCYIKFDSDDKIVYFACGELRNGAFSIEESIFPIPAETIGRQWVLSKGKSQFSNIHIFEDGILTHEDCSSGPWKSIKIDTASYESAFYN